MRESIQAPVLDTGAHGSRYHPWELQGGHDHPHPITTTDQQMENLKLSEPVNALPKYAAEPEEKLASDSVCLLSWFPRNSQGHSACLGGHTVWLRAVHSIRKQVLVQGLPPVGCIWANHLIYSSGFQNILFQTESNGPSSNTQDVFSDVMRRYM